MKQIYHVKIMVSDLENIFVRAENIEEAEKLVDEIKELIPEQLVKIFPY